MSWLEIFAVIVAILGIVFTILENRICWLINIAASLLYLKVFSDSNLPGQMLLQLLYIVVGIFGFYYWGSEDKVKIKQLGNSQTILLVAVSYLVGYLIYALTHEVLLADSALTIGSIVATYLATKKYVENWTFWIVIDLFSTGLFIYRELYPTAILYLIYTFLAAVGFRQWAKQLEPLD